MNYESNINEKILLSLQNKRNLKHATLNDDVDIESLFLDTIIYDEKMVFSTPINYKLLKKLYIDFYSIFTIGFIENPDLGYLFFVLRQCIGYDDQYETSTLIYSPSLFNLICHDISYYEKLILLESEESELPDFSNFSI